MFKLFKLGVSRLSDLKLDAIKDEFIAFDLLDEMLGEGDESLIQRISETMPVNKVSRRITYAGRYRSADEEIAKILSEKTDIIDALHVHDIGISNGITALELFQLLERSHEHIDFLATDKMVSIKTVTLTSFCRVIFNQDGYWLQIILGDLLCYRRMPKGGSEKIPVGNVIVTKMLAFWLPWYARWKSNQNEVLSKTISLFHPRVVEYAKTDQRFRIGQSDIFELPEKAYSLVRAMTVIFNWPDAPKEKAIYRLAGSVAEGGILVLGQGGGPYPLRCSIFQREGNRMLAIADVNMPAREKDRVLLIEL